MTFFKWFSIKTFSYDDNGNLKNPQELKEQPPLPFRLKWDFSDEQLTKNIDEAYTDALKIVNVSIIINIWFKY